jgi:hypothetical protein
MQQFSLTAGAASGFTFVSWWKKLLHLVGDLLELYDDARTYKP